MSKKQIQKEQSKRILSSFLNRPSFKERVLTVVASIPKGKTMTYGEVAKRAGVAGASRAVGTIMAHNNDKKIPCHRVVLSSGKIGAYNGLRGDEKERLLKKEGVKVVKGKVQR